MHYAITAEYTCCGSPLYTTVMRQNLSIWTPPRMSQHLRCLRRCSPSRIESDKPQLSRPTEQRKQNQCFSNYSSQQETTEHTSVRKQSETRCRAALNLCTTKNINEYVIVRTCDTSNHVGRTCSHRYASDASCNSICVPSTTLRRQ